MPVRLSLLAALAFRPARLAVMLRAALAVAAAMVAVLAFALLCGRTAAMGALAGGGCAALGGRLCAVTEGLAGGARARAHPADHRTDRPTE